MHIHRQTQTTPARRAALADLRGADIKPLQFSSEEVTQAETALGAQGVLLEGGHASESDLKHQNLNGFRVIHLAAHAFGDQLEPDRAGIVLYPGAKTEDGLWQAREIRGTRLRADVVVLSACETGTGRLEGEEGIMNLARAFLAAGAKSVVASQWDIDDRSTATLMESYYRQLATGKTVQGGASPCSDRIHSKLRSKGQPILLGWIFCVWRWKENNFCDP